MIELKNVEKYSTNKLTNSEINSLKTKVKTLEEENSTKDTAIQNLTTTVTSLSTDNTTNKNNITSHTTTLGTHTTSINSINSTLNSHTTSINALNAFQSKLGFDSYGGVSTTSVVYCLNSSTENPCIRIHTNGGFFYLITFLKNGSISWSKLNDNWTNVWTASNT